MFRKRRRKKAERDSRPADPSLLLPELTSPPRSNTEYEVGSKEPTLTKEPQRVDTRVAKAPENVSSANDQVGTAAQEQSVPTKPTVEEKERADRRLRSLEERSHTSRSSHSSSKEGSITVDLITMIDKRKWMMALRRIHSIPTLVRVKQELEFGETSSMAFPLHFAVSKKPPVNVVAALITAYKEAPAIPDERWGRLPLHIACCYRASTEVLKALLDAHPEATLLADKAEGRLPLHYACLYGTPYDVSLLLDIESRALNIRDASGKTPKELVDESFSPHREAILKRIDESSDQVDVSDCIESATEDDTDPSTHQSRNVAESPPRTAISNTDTEEQYENMKQYEHLMASPSAITVSTSNVTTDNTFELSRSPSDVTEETSNVSVDRKGNGKQKSAFPVSSQGRKEATTESKRPDPMERGRPRTRTPRQTPTSGTGTELTKQDRRKAQVQPDDDTGDSNPGPVEQCLDEMLGDNDGILNAPDTAEEVLVNTESYTSMQNSDQSNKLVTPSPPSRSDQVEPDPASPSLPSQRVARGDHYVHAPNNSLMRNPRFTTPDYTSNRLADIRNSSSSDSSEMFFDDDEEAERYQTNPAPHREEEASDSEIEARSEVTGATNSQLHHLELRRKVLEEEYSRVSQTIDQERAKAERSKSKVAKMKRKMLEMQKALQEEESHLELTESQIELHLELLGEHEAKIKATSIELETSQSIRKNLRNGELPHTKVRGRKTDAKAMFFGDSTRDTPHGESTLDALRTAREKYRQQKPRSERMLSDEDGKRNRLNDTMANEVTRLDALRATRERYRQRKSRSERMLFDNDDRIRSTNSMSTHRENKNEAPTSRRGMYHERKSRSERSLVGSASAKSTPSLDDFRPSRRSDAKKLTKSASFKTIRKRDLLHDEAEPVAEPSTKIIRNITSNNEQTLEPTQGEPRNEALAPAMKLDREGTSPGDRPLPTPTAVDSILSIDDPGQSPNSNDEKDIIPPAETNREPGSPSDSSSPKPPSVNRLISLFDLRPSPTIDDQKPTASAEAVDRERKSPNNISLRRPPDNTPLISIDDLKPSPDDNDRKPTATAAAVETNECASLRPSPSDEDQNPRHAPSPNEKQQHSQDDSAENSPSTTKKSTVDETKLTPTVILTQLTQAERRIEAIAAECGEDQFVDDMCVVQCESFTTIEDLNPSNWSIGE